MEFDSGKPIFQQIADWLGDAILTGAFPEEGQIPSITEISVRYKINPATALKGIDILVDDGTVYKKRGIGMFVSNGAREKLLKKRREEFYESFIPGLVTEAKRLGLSPEDIRKMIERGFGK